MVEFNQTREAGGRTYLQGFGGDTSNMAIAAARLVGEHGRVGYVTRVGDDAFGGYVRGALQAFGVAGPVYVHGFEEAAIDFVDDLQMPRQQLFELGDRPGFQCFRHEGVIGVAESVGGDRPGLAAHQRPVRQAAAIEQHCPARHCYSTRSRPMIRSNSSCSSNQTV